MGKKNGGRKVTLTKTITNEPEVLWFDVETGTLKKVNPKKKQDPTVGAKAGMRRFNRGGKVK